MSVKAASRPSYSIAGPMGRAYLRLPCGHQRVSLGWQEQQPGAAAQRMCRFCGRKFQIGLEPDGTAVVFLTGRRVRRVRRRGGEES